MTIKKYTTESGATYYHDIENGRVLRLGPVHDYLLNGQWHFLLNHSEIEVGKPIKWFLGHRNDVTTTPVVDIEIIAQDGDIHPYEQGSTMEDSEADYE